MILYFKYKMNPIYNNIMSTTMRPFIVGLTMLSMATISMSTQAKNIESFLDKNPPTSAFYNCAFKQKIGSQKCKVSLNEEKITDTRIKDKFGNSPYTVLKIHWPDNDISRYIILDSYELYNLGTRSHGFSFRTYEADTWEIDYSKGLIIEQNGKEHIRLW